MSLSNELVSVVMPAWNAADTITASLRSALNQSHSALELLVVDDGSADATRDIVEAIAREDGRIRLFKQMHLGPSAARNAAIRESQGAFIAPLDADDLWRPDYLEKMLRRLNSAPLAGFVYAGHRIIDTRNRVISGFPVFGLQGKMFLPHLLINVVGCGSAIVARKEAVLSAGLYSLAAFEVGGGEDYRLQLAMASQSHVAFLAEALVGYRRSSSSYSADATLAYTSRMDAVTEAFARLRFEPPRALLRWIKADAARAMLGMLFRRGEGGRALPALMSSMRDPLGLISDIIARVCNRLFNRAQSGVGEDFFALSSTFGLTPSRDRILLRRIRNLQSFEIERDVIQR